jgi:hypothetical protein
MNGWDGAWMTLMMGFWVALFGIAVYIAVKLATRPPSERRQL